MSLKSVSQKIADLITARKKKLAPKKTGALVNSISDSVKIGKGKVTITSKMNDYGYFQDSGVSGIKKKVNKNPQSFNPPGQFSGNFKMIGGNLPYGPRVSVYKNGFKPQPFIVPAVLQVMDSVGYDLLADYVSEEVILEFKKAFK